MKMLFLLLVNLYCFTNNLHSQTLVNEIDKANSPVRMDLLWNKSIAYIKKGEVIKLEKLIKQIENYNSYECITAKILIGDVILSLKQGQNSTAIKKFSEFVTIGIIHDLYLLQHVLTREEKGVHIKNLYREVVALQYQLKKIDFKRYMELINLIKNANNYSYNLNNYNSFVERELANHELIITCL